MDAAGWHDLLNYPCTFTVLCLRVAYISQIQCEKTRDTLACVTLTLLVIPSSKLDTPGNLYNTKMGKLLDTIKAKQSCLPH